MSNDRRRQRRQQRQRQRRDRGPTYEPAGAVKFPGVFGWLQRRQRAFFAIGILVMIASLGAVFFGSQLGASSGDSSDSAQAAAEPTEAPDDSGGEVAATETPEADAADATATPATDDAGDEPIQRVYSAAPAMAIDPERSFEAIIHTEKGSVRIELLASEAPGYVNNFVFLARNRFYDGLTFHRVVPGFVAQAGDPTATGFSGSGYELAEEFNDLAFDAGVISMAKAGASVDGSQFFVTLEPQPQLKEAGFTVFGRVTEGLDVLRGLTSRDPQQPGQPPGDRILSIEIHETGAG